MSVIATALKHMLAAGMPHDAIVAAVAEMEANAPVAVDPVAERRRTYDRDRKRIKREAERKSVESGGSPVEAADKADIDPLPLPPNENKSNPPTPAPENKPHTREAPDAHVAAWEAWRVKHPFPRPHWADRAVWTDFLAVRKRKDMVNTPTAHRKLLRDMGAAVARTGWPPGCIFEACVEQGWGAIYDTDEMKAAINANGNGGNQRSARQHSGGRARPDGFQAACADDLAAHQARRSAADRAGDHRRLAAPGIAPL